jgi:hypothetical protein
MQRNLSQQKHKNNFMEEDRAENRIIVCKQISRTQGLIFLGILMRGIIYVLFFETKKSF